MIEDAKESKYETQVDYTFFTEPVSCEVRNDVGSTNVSTLVDVHCEWGARLPRPRQERASFLGKPHLLPAAPPTFSPLGPWSPLGPLREKGWLPCHLLPCSPLLVAPRIVVDPKPLTTDIGSDVTLTCVWTGNPPLTLTWAKKESNMVRSLLAPEDQIWGWGLQQLFLRSSSSLGWGLHPCLDWVLSGGRKGRCCPMIDPPPLPPPKASCIPLRPQILGNSNQLHLKSVKQSDAGLYVCKAIVPRIGVGEREVALFVNGE